MIESEHPKSLDPRVWADALRAHADAWGKDEALDRESLSAWFRDAMSQGYEAARKEFAPARTRNPCFYSHEPNPARRHWWQFWIPAYVPTKRGLKP